MHRKRLVDGALLGQAEMVQPFADQVVCKLVYNERTGKIRLIFLPDNEYIPVYSDDDFEDLVAAHFVKGVKFEVNDEEIDAIQKQSFTLINDKAYVEEAIYRESDLALLKTIQRRVPLGLDRKSTRLNSSHVA